MDDSQLLNELHQRLGWQGGTRHDALRAIEQLVQLAHRVLDPQDLAPNLNAETRNQARAGLGKPDREPVNTPRNYPRLSLLTDFRAEASNLLLASIAGTHQDVLEMHELDESHALGIRACSARFTHRCSGIDYVIAVAADHAEPAMYAAPAGARGTLVAPVRAGQ